MGRILIIGIAVLALGYAAFCAFMYFVQRSMIYFPTPRIDLPNARPISFETEGATLQIWTRPAGPRAIIYFGGNAENVAYSFEEFSELLPEHSLYFVNYRGYGGSTGSPTEAALFADAEAVFDMVKTRHGLVDVVGRSLGSGVAVHLAAVRPVEKLVLVTPYDSLANVAKEHFPIFPVGLLLRDKFDSASKASAVTARTMVITAEADTLIPRESSEALAAAFSPGRIEAVVIPKTDHNSIDGAPEYAASLRRFLLD